MGKKWGHHAPGIVMRGKGGGGGRGKKKPNSHNVIKWG